jgi:hypothetical protein
MSMCADERRPPENQSAPGVFAPVTQLAHKALPDQEARSEKTRCPQWSLRHRQRFSRAWTLPASPGPGNHSKIANRNCAAKRVGSDAQERWHLGGHSVRRSSPLLSVQPPLPPGSLQMQPILRTRNVRRFCTEIAPDPNLSGVLYGSLRSWIHNGADSQNGSNPPAATPG